MARVGRCKDSDESRLWAEDRTSHVSAFAFFQLALSWCMVCVIMGMCYDIITAVACLLGLHVLYLPTRQVAIASWRCCTAAALPLQLQLQLGASNLPVLWHRPNQPVDLASFLAVLFLLFPFLSLLLLRVFFVLLSFVARHCVVACCLRAEEIRTGQPPAPTFLASLTQSSARAKQTRWTYIPSQSVARSCTLRLS